MKNWVRKLGLIILLGCSLIACVILVLDILGIPQKWAQEAAAARLNQAMTGAPWKTIKLGSYKTIPELHSAMIRARIKVDPWAYKALERTHFSTIKTDLDLVVVSVDELGIKSIVINPSGDKYIMDQATRADIYKRAQELGLEFCPPEVGALLRLQHLDQPEGERLLIASEPVTDADGYTRIFTVHHSKSRGKVDLWLDATWGEPGQMFYGDNKWVFVRPRQ